MKNKKFNIQKEDVLFGVFVTSVALNLVLIIALYLWTAMAIDLSDEVKEMNQNNICSCK